ncbi:hypothetical protein [Paraburkholderia graminis]
MTPENNSPTNEPIESASQESHGGNVGGALSESDFIRYFNDKHSGNTEPAAKAETEASADEDVVDISELEDDSSEQDTTDTSSDSTDTNADAVEESKEEPVFEIQVDGKTIEVKQSELIADAQKHRSSENKFKEASDMRKEADEVKAFYTQDRDNLKNLLAQYQNFMNEHVGNVRKPDLSLAQADPAAYVQQMAMYEAVQQERAQVQAHQEQIRKQEELERTNAVEKNLKQQKDMVFAKFPQWKNPDVLQRDHKLILDYLNTSGFTPQEQDGLQDARMLEVVYKAAKYDQAVKAKDQKKAKPQAGKTLTSGASQSADPSFQKRQAQTQNAREAKALQERFKQDGSRDAFVEMFKNQMRNKR